MYKIILLFILMTLRAHFSISLMVGSSDVNFKLILALKYKTNLIIKIHTIFHVAVVTLSLEWRPFAYWALWKAEKLFFLESHLDDN